jgi:UDP:flavonoid glycosyltransferase YjiC (YdhE family)
MARFLFLTWNGAGNQPPAVAIAQALKSRGHTVTFAGYENQRSYFGERDLPFVILERSATKWRDDTRQRMFAVKLQAVWASLDHLDDVPHLIAHENCDAVIVDCLMFGALAAAEKLQKPAVALVHSAPGALMPPEREFERLLLDAVNQVRMRAGLLAIKNLWEAWARFPAFSNSIPQLDPLASQAPPSFSYFGPMEEPIQLSGWKLPWPHTDRRPLVLVSFSTGPYWDQTSRIVRTLQALSRCDCRVLVTAGPTEIDPMIVPDNAIVVGRVPHNEILPKTRVTISHAGHGTVITSLKHGVPLLSLPNPVADQPILARQVEALGCGLSLDGELATTAEIKEGVDRLLGDPSYSANALMLGETISQSPGVSSVVSELETLVRPHSASLRAGAE